MIRWTRFETPFGGTFAASTVRGPLRLQWGMDDPEELADRLRESFPLWGVERDDEALAGLVEQVTEFFAGDRRSFDLSPDFTGLTDFQKKVLRKTSEIPFGHTVTYGEVARRIGKPRASRAVGAALGRNPLPVVVPCHRVVRSDGTVGGYTAGEGYKRQLLELEARA